MAAPGWEELVATHGPRTRSAYNGGPGLHAGHGQPRETYRVRERRMLGEGLHPRTALPLLPGEHGHTCGDCAHLCRIGMAGTYHKCGLTRATWSGGRASDVLVKWPACARWALREEDD